MSEKSPLVRSARIPPRKTVSGPKNRLSFRSAADRRLRPAILRDAHISFPHLGRTPRASQRVGRYTASWKRETLFQQSSLWLTCEVGCRGTVALRPGPYGRSGSHRFPRKRRFRSEAVYALHRRVCRRCQDLPGASLPELAHMSMKRSLQVRPRMTYRSAARRRESGILSTAMRRSTNCTCIRRCSACCRVIGQPFKLERHRMQGQ